MSNINYQGLLRFGFLFVVVLWRVEAISNVESNVQNTITEEERRGAPTPTNSGGYNENSKKKIIVDDNDKKTRGIHSTSASHKHHHFFVPSGYDSQIAATGHGGGGSGYNVGPTTGYEYGAPHGTAPSSVDHAGGSVHGGHGHHVQAHNVGTGYATGTGYGSGYGVGQGYGHSGGFSVGGHIGGHSGHGGHGGHIGHGDGGHGGHSLYGGQGGFHNALALKGLLIPLAGIALLGAAAALSTNPVLLQLGVVNGKRRRRRSARALSEQHKSSYPSNPHVRPDGV